MLEFRDCLMALQEINRTLAFAIWHVVDGTLIVAVYINGGWEFCWYCVASALLAARHIYKGQGRLPFGSIITPTCRRSASALSFARIVISPCVCSFYHWQETTMVLWVQSLMLVQAVRLGFGWVHDRLYCPGCTPNPSEPALKHDH